MSVSSIEFADTYHPWLTAQENEHDQFEHPEEWVAKHPHRLIIEALDQQMTQEQGISLTTLAQGAPPPEWEYIEMGKYRCITIDEVNSPMRRGYVRSHNARVKLDQDYQAERISTLRFEELNYLIDADEELLSYAI